jgi:hypothetical protein
MKSTLLVLLVILAVVSGIWYLRSDEAEEPEKKGTTQQQNNTSTPSTSNSSDSSAPDVMIEEDEDTETVVEEVPNGLQGELRASNDSNRGNIMLLLNDSDRIIYLNTARDYSALFGKNVLVKIDGSMDDFRLVDIIEQGN